MGNKSRFVLYFGTRDVFPSSLVASAREEIERILTGLGHEVVLMDEMLTNAGAVETRQEGNLYSEFLAQKKGNYDGVIIVLPNFGDENGAMAAFKDVDVPVLILAYSDELDKMAPGVRRDAFCGKFSIMDVFCQQNIKFTALQPHTITPGSEQFNQNIDYFDRLCRVVCGMQHVRIGSIGARVTPFKTVRVDEVALQRHNITVESYDLSFVFDLMDKMPKDVITAKIESLKKFTDFSCVPKSNMETLAKLGAAIDKIVADDALDSIALRCWFEIQSQLNVSPCVLLGQMNQNGIVGACEVDIANAVVMRALYLASGRPTACLDWNNNYGDECDKCILFHCGPVPTDMMCSGGKVTDHDLIATVLGKGKSYGCNVGRLSPGPITFGSMLTRDGRCKFFLGEGDITKDSIPKEFFGCAGVFKINQLQDVLQYVGYAGHRHHVSIGSGHVMGPVKEAFEKYLDFDVDIPQNPLK